MGVCFGFSRIRRIKNVYGQQLFLKRQVLSKQALVDHSQYGGSYTLLLSSLINLSYPQHHPLPPSLFVKDQKSSTISPSAKTPHIPQYYVSSLCGTYQNHHPFLDLIHFSLENTRLTTCLIAYPCLALKLVFSSLHTPQCLLLHY